MKAYISVSYRKRKIVSKVLNALKTTLVKLNIGIFVFVDNYNFDITEERQMMKQATEDIEHCDIVIAEVSDKAIGIGIEVGYAKAKKKPVIYLRRKNAKHSTTVSGISDFQIIYDNIADLEWQLENILPKVLEQVKNGSERN